MDVIAAQRPKGFVEHLYKHGIHPTILTHRWELNEDRKWITHDINAKVEFERFDTHNVIRVPRSESFTPFWIKSLIQYRPLKILFIPFFWLVGFFELTLEAFSSYFSFKSFLIQHLKDNHYDFIIPIFSPHHHLRLSYKLSKRTGVKFIADLRDLWDNRAVDPSFPFDFKTQLQYKLIRYYWSKWLGKASFFSTISNQWKDTISNVTPTPGYVVTHGFDDDIKNLTDSSNFNESFTCLYSGTLYNNQDLSGFLKGFRKFIDNNNDPKIKLIFVGSVREKQSTYSTFFEGLEEELKLSIPKKYYSVVPRVPRSKLLTFLSLANAYLMLSYHNMKGTHSGKLFEYIGNRKPILLHPSDKSVIEEALNLTKLGYISVNESELADNLQILYENWKSGKKIEYDEKEIYKWSREHQTERMSELIKGYLKA
jgi:hypothetical protein